MKNRTKKVLCLILIAVLALTSGCTLPGAYWTQGEIPESSEGEDLTIGEAVDNVFSLNSNAKYSFNPLIATNHSNQLICCLVYENMIELDNNFDVIPNVVTEWECNDAGTTWYLTIDTSHTFSDGSPVTSKDLRYSLDRAVSSDRYAGRFTTYLGASQDGEDKLVVTVSVGDSQFIKLLNIPIIQYGSYDEKFPIGSGPYMYNISDVVTKTKIAQYGQKDGSGEETTAEGESTPKPEEPEEPMTAEIDGVVVNTVSESSIPSDSAKILMDSKEVNGYTLKTYKVVNYLEPNPHFASAATLPLSRVNVYSYTDAGDIIDTFESSKIDVVINDPSSYTNLGYATTNEIHRYSTTNMHFVGFNQERTVGQMSGFRFAMQYAFNRAALVDLLNNNAVASAIPMYPTCADFPVDLDNALEYDLEKCKTILANTGIRDYDEDGWCEWMNGGSTIDVQFILCSDSSAKAGVVNRFKEDMATIGIKVTVRELTWDDYYDALTDYERYTEEQLKDEDFKPIEYDMYYAEVKLRNNFDLTQLLQERTEDNAASNINFTHSMGNGYETYLYNYLSSGNATRKSNYRAFAEYVLTNLAQFVVIGFEKQQLITHRQAIRGVNPNMGNPLYGFKDWTIMFKEETSK